MHLTEAEIILFRNHIWSFYKTQGRIFSWRQTRNSYHIVVSEVMLQQTQTQRVIGKYEEFIAAFPTWKELADASIHDVLTVWQGLGYNRRALALHIIASKVINECNGILPSDPQVLVTFSGIGPATAASICAFAFNQPTLFIETNIRTVCLHAFFKDETMVTDKQLMPYVAAILDKSNPREWYYALTDYGVMLKKLYPDAHKASKHYTKQAAFKGSDRQIRGLIVRLLLQHVTVASENLISIINDDQERIKKILDQLHKEGFIRLTHAGEIELRDTKLYSN